MTRFVSDINLLNPKHVIIPAGNSFDKEDLVTATFDALMRQGHIEAIVPGVPNFTGGEGPTGKKVMTVGLDNATPSGALKKMKTDPVAQEQKRKDRAEAVAKVNAENKAKEVTDADKDNLRTAIGKLTGKTPKKSTSVPDLIKMLNKANTEEAKRVKGSTEPIWISDPEVIKNLDEAVLIDAYKKVCKQYEFEVKEFDTKEALVSQLSADFVPEPKSE